MPALDADSLGSNLPVQNAKKLATISALLFISMEKALQTPFASQFSAVSLAADGCHDKRPAPSDAPWRTLPPSSCCRMDSLAVAWNHHPPAKRGKISERQSRRNLKFGGPARAFEATHA